MRTKLTKLPKVVYVYQDENRDHTYDLLVTHDLAERGEGLVGIYDLREHVHTRYQPQVKREGTKTWFPLGDGKEK